MNAGGDPGRDDYGLPPADIEVPDDARELSRDVQAYHRELRSLHRQRLARRFYGPLTRDGMVLPLLAGCLALTLVAATLLTVFTARQPTVGLRPQSPRAQPAATLVNAILFAAGQPTPLNSLPGQVVVLALIPPGCHCLSALRELTIEASQARTTIYLVGVHNAPVGAFTAQLGLGATQGLEDSADALPARYRVTTLTAVVVRPDGTALRVVHKGGSGFQIEPYVRAMIPAMTTRRGTAGESPAAGTASGSPATSATSSASAPRSASATPAAGSGSAASSGPPG